MEMSGLVIFLVLIKCSVISGILNEDCNVKGVEKVYDYIIEAISRTNWPFQLINVNILFLVGGGSTGCVIANRLSDDQGTTVLLLEAGGPDTNIPEAPFIEIPQLRSSALFSNISLQLPTVPQKHVFKNTESNASVKMLKLTTHHLKCFKNKSGFATGHVFSGRVLGGSSAINGAAYFRGGKPDFDNWVKMGADGWSYDEVLPYFLKSEGTRIPEFENSKFHNRYGPLVINAAGRTKLVDLVFKGADELGYPVVDCNEADPMGVCLDQKTIVSGETTTTSRAFLHSVIGRPNLKILINDKTKTAEGVEFKLKGNIKRVEVRKEVILSAGTYFSPQILQLSGIGPKNLLRKHKIPVITDLPVGENMQDGLTIFSDLFVDLPTKRIENLTDPAVMANYIFNREGFYREALSFASIISNSKSKIGDPKLKNILLFFRDGISSNTAAFNLDAFKKNLSSSGRDGITVGIHAIHPKSRGYVKITSSNPETLPQVDPKYLDFPDDFKLLLEAIRLTEELSRTPSFKAINGQFESPINECSEYKFRSEDYWRCYVSFRAFSLGHVVGTCKMGRIDDNTTVVDSRLRVKGIKRLRVADASVIPEVTSGVLPSTMTLKS
ncbi:hypothetical protein KUTeg_000266 [Tegillarca granosa]|uniref:Glucose-methanol-choline oxidoreductase N-terminal domain-containing protein n=1 Tax=Tegillarca granosa TaxID=220873 RepID=A0ABQ9G1G4_TEGGR|nr:hypothetical protein KUTeg_000266 [Tegillarca granosa]